MIRAAPFHTLSQREVCQVFAVSTKEISEEAEKKDRLLLNHLI